MVVEVEYDRTIAEPIWNGDLVRVPAHELAGFGDGRAVMRRTYAICVCSKTRVAGRVVESSSPPVGYIFGGLGEVFLTLLLHHGVENGCG